MADGINPVKVEEIIRRRLCLRQLIGQIDEGFRQGPVTDGFRTFEKRVRVNGGGVFAVLEDGGSHALLLKGTVEVGGRVKTGWFDSGRFERIPLGGAGEGVEQGGDNGIHYRIVVIPLEDTVFADRHSSVDGCDMGCSGGRELRGQLYEGSRAGYLLEEGRFLEFFKETPTKRVDQEENHSIILVG